MAYLDEAQLEIVVCDWLTDDRFGGEHVHGPEIAPNEPSPERADYGQVVLFCRLREALTSTLLISAIALPTAAVLAEEATG